MKKSVIVLCNILLLVTTVKGSLPIFRKLTQVGATALCQMRGVSQAPMEGIQFFRKKQQMPIVLLDGAGSVADPTSGAPLESFKEVYKGEGIEISEQEARLPMGVNKKEHIRQIQKMSSRVKEEWKRFHSCPMNEADVERMYFHFTKSQIGSVKKHSVLIDGALSTQNFLREIGVEYIGGTTGYFKEAAQAFREKVEQQGFYFDEFVCPDDVGGKGRPTVDQKTGGYDMIVENMKRAGVNDPCLVINAGDTWSDVESIRRLKEVFGMPGWSVGFFKTGNNWPYSAEELAAMSSGDYMRRIKHAQHQVRNANFIIPSIQELPLAVAAIVECNKVGITPDEYKPTILNEEQAKQCRLSRH